MIKNYDNFLDQIKYHKNQRELSIKTLYEKIIEDLDYEFSKHLKFIYPYKTKTDLKIFLIDNDYGLRIETPIYYEYDNSVKCIIRTVFKQTDGIWSKTSAVNNNFIFNQDRESVEDFVKYVVETVKKRNITRKNAKEKRELNRYTKKYNL